MDRRREHAKVADEAAKLGTFATYRSKKARNTIRRQDGELARFGVYVQGEALSTDAGAWTGISWGLVDSFIKSLLMDGYAIGTINAHLSTIKRYSKLATLAGTLPRTEYAMITLVEGHGHREGQHVDETRKAMGKATRRPGAKKATSRVLTHTEAAAMLARCGDSPQGRRDRLILVLLLELGVRVSEAADLRGEHFDSESCELTVYRRKTDTTTTFKLRNGLLAAMLAYLDVAGTEGQLLKGSLRDGTLEGSMSTRAIRERVHVMAAGVGIGDLGCHDLRHTQATWMARAGASMTDLMEFFGWNSPAMAARYVESAAVIAAG